MALKTEVVGLLQAAWQRVRTEKEVVLLSSGLALTVWLALATVLIALFVDIDLARLRDAVQAFQAVQRGTADPAKVVDQVQVLVALLGYVWVAGLLAYPVFSLVWARTLLKGRSGVLARDDGRSLVSLYGLALGRELLSLVILLLLVIVLFVAALVVGGLIGVVFMALGLESVAAVLGNAVQAVLSAIILGVYAAALNLSLVGAAVGQGPGVFAALKHVTEQDRRLLVTVIAISLAGTLANTLLSGLGALIGAIALLGTAVVWVLTSATNLAACALAWSEGPDPRDKGALGPGGDGF